MAYFRKHKVLTTTFLVLICIFVLLCVISYIKLGIANPFTSGMAIFRVMFTDADYIEVKNYPKIIIAKSDNAENRLIEYMEVQGFSYDASEYTWPTMRFENGISAQYVSYSNNGFFACWRWRE